MPDYSRNYKKVEIKLVDGVIITGKINLGETTKRISDLLAQMNNNFIAITQATIFDDGNMENDVAIVNKSQIMWVVPID